jgi:alpha-L-rhamnosidase
MLCDCGQNLTGWLRIAARGPAGAAITVRHAEVLDDHGRLHTAALRNARATDSYVLDDSGRFALEPAFTFHGFRYAEIAADDGVTIERVEARVITSNLDPIGSFDCSDPLVYKLWDNVRWSQRGNFLALPTDCPQRDERLGWTGDIQVFAPAACMNADVDAFLVSWLADLALEQRKDGCVPAVVPNVLPGHEFEFGSVGWGDAATLVPWALYESYGDTEVLRRQFGSMAAWVDWCASRLNPHGVWEGDFQLGDWLDPGAPPDAPHRATTSGDYIASAYLTRSAAIVAAAARVLGMSDRAVNYAALSAAVAAATWRKWRDHAVTTQTGCAIAIEFGIAPVEEHGAIADRLAALVEGGDSRIATGFLGTPLVLPALTRAGRIDAAYRLLLNRNAPGWLYQVLRGATTIWERWDAIREDGSIHPGDMSVGEGASMMSFNHYAYGAVAAWLYRSLAGIAPIADHPGYQRIRFAPRPGGGITHASAAIRTPFGKAAIAWRVEGPDRLCVDLEIPPGATGLLSAPPGWRIPDAGDALLASGAHRIELQAGAPA